MVLKKTLWVLLYAVVNIILSINPEKIELVALTSRRNVNRNGFSLRNNTLGLSKSVKYLDSSRGGKLKAIYGKKSREAITYSGLNICGYCFLVNTSIFWVYCLSALISWEGLPSSTRLRTMEEYETTDVNGNAQIWTYFGKNTCHGYCVFNFDHYWVDPMSKWFLSFFLLDLMELCILNSCLKVKQ